MSNNSLPDAVLRRRKEKLLAEAVSSMAQGMCRREGLDYTVLFKPGWLTHEYAHLRWRLIRDVYEHLKPSKAALARVFGLDPKTVHFILKREYRIQKKAA